MSPPGPLPGGRLGPPGMGSGHPVQHARNARQAIARLSHRLAGQRLGTALVLLGSALSVLLNVLGPWQLGRATDLVVTALQAHQALDFQRLGLHLLGVAGLYGGGALLAAQQGWMSNRLVQTLTQDLRRDAQAKLARLPLGWFDTRARGEVLSRVTNDIDNVSQSLMQMLGPLTMALLQVLGVVTMMCILSPLLTLAALLSLGASLALARRLGGQAQPHYADQWRWTGQLNGQIEEQFTGQTLVKVYGHQAVASASFEQANNALRQSALKAQFISGAIQPAILFVGNLGFIGVVGVGALRVMAGVLSVGQLQSFIQYVRQLTQPLNQISGMAAVLQSAAASAERVFELLDAPEMSPDPSPAATLPQPARGHVVFEQVHFRYQPQQPLIEGIDLEARPGQTIAIVGPTGAGKTTLVNLLMRFYEVDGGRITLDGVDIRQLAREDLRHHLGMVLQDTWLFEGTIRENLAYGREGATEDEVREAARACHVDDFVRTLPRGYDTLLDENGSGLSAGQRQLLTIARAFVARPTVLILDEATSSVDTRTEVLVQQAMARLRAGRTSFVIAHRLSTIRHADCIVYLDGGRVREQGTHEALVERRGAYWRLLQAAAAP